MVKRYFQKKLNEFSILASGRKMSVRKSTRSILTASPENFDRNSYNVMIESYNLGGDNGTGMELENKVNNSIELIDEDTLERIDFFGGLLHCLHNKRRK